jgi:hypothetical protein
MNDTKNMNDTANDGSDVDNFPEKQVPVHTEMIVGETAAENHYYQQFAAATPEWRAAFEKTLMRKVDLRLVPLLIVSSPVSGAYPLRFPESPLRPCWPTCKRLLRPITPLGQHRTSTAN